MSEEDKKAEAEEPAASQSEDAEGSSGVKEQLEAGFEEVKQLAADLGMKLGAAASDASTEAKEGWKKMEPGVKEKLKTAEAALGEVTDVAAEQLKGLFGELKSSFQKVKEKM